MQYLLTPLMPSWVNSQHCLPVIKSGNQLYFEFPFWSVGFSVVTKTIHLDGFIHLLEFSVNKKMKNDDDVSGSIGTRLGMSG